MIYQSIVFLPLAGALIAGLFGRAIGHREENDGLVDHWAMHRIAGELGVGGGELVSNIACNLTFEHPELATNE